MTVVLILLPKKLESYAHLNAFTPTAVISCDYVHSSIVITLHFMSLCIIMIIEQPVPGFLEYVSFLFFP